MILFYLSIFLRWLIVIYTFQLMPSSLLQVLLVESSNLNENLNCTLYSIHGVDWIKGLVRYVNSVNVFVSVPTSCGSYFLPETSTSTLFCLILISVQNKNTYFHLSNFQHIPLSSGMSQNVILSIFKNG